MNEEEFIEELELILDLENGDLEKNPELAHSENWDSVNLLGIIALIDEHFDIEIDIKTLRSCNGLEFLTLLIGDKFTS